MQCQGYSSAIRGQAGPGQADPGATGCYGISRPIISRQTWCRTMYTIACNGQCSLNTSELLEWLDGSLSRSWSFSFALSTLVSSHITCFQPVLEKGIYQRHRRRYGIATAAERTLCWNHSLDQGTRRFGRWRESRSPVFLFQASMRRCGPSSFGERLCPDLCRMFVLLHFDIVSSLLGRLTTRDRSRQRAAATSMIFLSHRRFGDATYQSVPGHSTTFSQVCSYF